MISSSLNISLHQFFTNPYRLLLYCLIIPFCPDPSFATIMMDFVRIFPDENRCKHCHEGREVIQPPILVMGRPICLHCFERLIRPAFQNALDDDAMFPLQVSGEDVNVSGFKSLLTEAEMEAYDEKSRRLFHEVFYCEVCAQDVRSIHASVDVVGNKVCHDCVRDSVVPLFRAAIMSEEEYPPKWGGVTMDIRAFVEGGLVSNELVNEYLEKEEEYRISLRDRVYCAQSECVQPFLGSASSISSTLQTCRRCDGLTCLKCRRYTLNTVLPKDAAPHQCESYNHSDGSLSAFPERTRGIEWQLCPGCAAPSTLQDGCNYVTCTLQSCGMGYCFWCGQPADEYSRHWKDVCPRWTNTGSVGGPQFEPEDSEEEDGEIIEEAEAGENADERGGMDQ